MERLPQVMINVARRRQGAGRATTSTCWPRSPRPRTSWPARGRVLLRPSGTEPLVRVMVEAPEADQAQAVADRLAVVVREHLAL